MWHLTGTLTVQATGARTTLPLIMRGCSDNPAANNGCGGNIQAMFTPRGIPLWVSAVLPGGVHDITAARELFLAVLRPFLKDLPVLADSGYEGAGCASMSRSGCQQAAGSLI
jgi:hypothetical protein